MMSASLGKSFESRYSMLQHPFCNRPHKARHKLGICPQLCLQVPYWSLNHTLRQLGVQVIEPSCKQMSSLVGTMRISSIVMAARHRIDIWSCQQSAYGPLQLTVQPAASFSSGMLHGNISHFAWLHYHSIEEFVLKKSGISLVSHCLPNDCAIFSCLCCQTSFCEVPNTIRQRGLVGHFLSCKILWVVNPVILPHK